MTHEGKHPITNEPQVYELGRFGPNSIIGCAEYVSVVSSDSRCVQSAGLPSTLTVFIDVLDVCGLAQSICRQIQ